MGQSGAPPDQMGRVFRRQSGGRLRVSAASTARGAAAEKPEQTAVIFTVPEKRLLAMDVATGPCVPAGGRKHLVVSVHHQEGPERPEQMAALYWLLTGGAPAGGSLIVAERRSTVGRRHAAGGQENALSLRDADHTTGGSGELKR
jgi:hypothetical protein